MIFLEQAILAQKTILLEAARHFYFGCYAGARFCIVFECLPVVTDFTADHASSKPADAEFSTRPIRHSGAGSKNHR